MIVFVLIIVVLPFIIWLLNSAKKTAAQNAFADLGDIRGKPISEIIAKVGAPNAISAQGAGIMLYQWLSTTSAGGIHIAMLVDPEGNAIGYTHAYVG